MNVTGASTKEQQLDELITLAQDAETAYARSRAPDGGGYARPTYAQFVRITVAVLDRHEKMCFAKWLKQLPAENAAQRAEIERQVRAKVADAMEAAVMPLPDPMYVQGWLAGAEFVRGDSDA